ncbi:MAG: Hsp20/alpha crystallin family protein [Desulfatiglandaceae bacterium]|jgi:HSP20 family protein
MYLIKVKFDPNLRALQNKMQDLMDEMMHLKRPVMAPSRKDWTPEADVYETREDIMILLNLAGVEKKHIAVSFHENHLRVEGKRVQNISSGTPVRYHQLEMGHGDFERTFRIPAAIDEEKIEAFYTDGLLTIRIKKASVPQSVSVNVNF